MRGACDCSLRAAAAAEIAAEIARPCRLCITSARRQHRRETRAIAFSIYIYAAFASRELPRGFDHEPQRLLKTSSFYARLKSTAPRFLPRPQP
eukprot:1846514-Pleurochrysis_carterae.AAC.1